ncbi:MAG: hypothetical protein RL117_1121 [Verrucomicrobiota bacterium]
MGEWAMSEQDHAGVAEKDDSRWSLKNVFAYPH